MERQDLHHPSPRLPDGWKQFQADNIDVTTTSELPSGRRSRSASSLSNHNFAAMSITPGQIQGHSGQGQNLGDFRVGDTAALSGDLGLGRTSAASQFSSDQDGIIAQFAQSGMDEFDFGQTSESGRSSGHGGSDGYFHRAAGTAAINTATTQPLHSTLNPTTTDHAANSAFDDYYLDSNDPSSNSPFLNPNAFAGDTSPPSIQQHQPQDSLSPYSSYHTSFDTQQQNTLQPQPQFEPSSNNNLGLHWTHHRSFSDQSDISSNASPFIGSVHSEHGSPFIHPQNDNNFEDDLREAILGLDMGAPFDVAAQHYNTHQFDTSTLELDQQGFPVDAPLFERQDQYQNYENHQNNSRPTSSSSYHQPSFPQSIFTSGQSQNISTSLSQSFQSPPLPSATSIPEIEVTVAPPTPRSQALNSFLPYNGQQNHHSAHNSPSLPPSYIFSNPDPLALPPAGRRRAVSDSGTRPSFSMMPPHSNLARRVSSGSHPYLAVQGDSPSSSGRSSPNRGHRRSISSGNHNMTHREVLDLVKNDGPREAKNPKKYVCDYPGCGQRFTRNSNKTYPPPNSWELILEHIC